MTHRIRVVLICLAAAACVIVAGAVGGSLLAAWASTSDTPSASAAPRPEQGLDSAGAPGERFAADEHGKRDCPHRADDGAGASDSSPDAPDAAPTAPSGTSSAT